MYFVEGMSLCLVGSRAAFETLARRISLKKLFETMSAVRSSHTSVKVVGEQLRTSSYLPCSFLLCRRQTRLIFLRFFVASHRVF